MVHDPTLSVEAVLSSRGQITIPKAVRDAMYLQQGDKVEFTLRSGEVTLSPSRRETPDPVARWVGSLPSAAGPGGGKAWVRGLRGYEDEVLD